MAYLVSTVGWITVMMLFKKIESKQNFWRSIILTIVAYECYLCMIAGIMTVLHIPVDIYTISAVNVLCIVGMGVFLFKKKEMQHYYIKFADTVFVIIYSVIIVWLFLRRFSCNLDIVFETSDPGTHLKMAMNFVNNKAVDGMYIGQLLNGLMIESLVKIFPGELVYKSMIIQCGINLYVAGLTFWATVQRSGKNAILQLVTYVVTFIYVLGYPYNDFLYGFVYLQMTITVICFLISLMQDYVYEQVNIWSWGLLVGAGCLSVSIGYTLFAPPVYISTLGFVAYKAYREKWLYIKEKPFLTKKFVMCALNIFLIPTALTIWILIIGPKFSANEVDYVGNLIAEGAIYRNLYSDFLLYIMPAIYAIIYSMKKKRANLVTFLFPIYGIYYVVFLVMMLSNKVSTYYFYKLNYTMWMLVLVAFVIGMGELIYREKIIFGSILVGIVLLAGIHISGIEIYYQQKDINNLPYIESSTFFRIYDCNKLFEAIHSQMDNGLVEISGVVNQMNNEEDVVFIGYWQDLFWYEALTNQRLSTTYRVPYAELINMFMNGRFGEYAVVKKDSEGIEEYQQFIDENTVYESDYAYLLKR